MQVFFGIIVGILVLMFLIVAHEFGHFLMARKNGVKVNEFGIGFPPRAKAWLRKEVEVKDKNGKTVKKPKWIPLPKSEWDKPQDELIFSINWLPIGGFCAMDGESDADTKKGTFGAANFWQKTKILFGGVAMNWLVAFVLLTVLAFTGMPQFLPNQFYLKNDAKVSGGGVAIEKVLEDSPAAKAGLKEGDIIISIAGEGVNSPMTITEYGDAHRGEKTTYTIQREVIDYQNDCVTEPCPQPTRIDTLEIPVTLGGPDEQYALGVQMSYSQSMVRSTWSAPLVGLGTTLQITGETFKGLGELVWNLFSGIFRQLSPNSTVRDEGQAAISSAGDSVSGPIGIIGGIFPAFVSAGLSNLAFLAALISISLACMNVLPIPALDGGRWLLIAIYRLRKKPLTKETEEKIVSRAFIVLIGLIVIITILDIIKLF